MNEYELIGRLADLDARVKKLEGVEPVPQPRTPRLVEACADYIDWVDTGCAYATDYKLQGYYTDKIRLALAAEKKRQELVESIITNWRDGCDWKLNAAIKALDAYDDQGRRDNDKERG